MAESFVPQIAPGGKLPAEGCVGAVVALISLDFVARTAMCRGLVPGI